MLKTAFNILYILTNIRKPLPSFSLSINPNIKVRPLFYTSLIFIIIINISCSDKTLTPEDEIKQYIKSGKLAAENRSHGDLANLISKDYRDQRNWDKKQIENIARAYFLTHQNIHLFTKIQSITFQTENKAFVILHVAMAGTVINDITTISKLRARIYEFQLQLIKTDSWLLQQAKWKSASVSDML